MLPIFFSSFFLLENSYTSYGSIKTDDGHKELNIVIQLVAIQLVAMQHERVCACWRFCDVYLQVSKIRAKILPTLSVSGNLKLSSFKIIWKINVRFHHKKLHLFLPWTWPSALNFKHGSIIATFHLEALYFKRAFFPIYIFFIFCLLL